MRPPRLQFKFTSSCRFFFALYCAGFSSHLLSFILAIRICRSLVVLLCTLASRDLSASPSCFYRIPLPLIFGLLRSLLHICRLSAFLSVPTCFVFCLARSFFYVPVHGFALPPIWGKSKEPTYLSKSVGHEVLGVVVWPCLAVWCFT